MTAKPLPEAKEIVSCPYLTQAKRSPVLVESSEEAAEVADAVFNNVSVSLPLQTVYKEFPGLMCMIEKRDKELAKAQYILAVLPPFGFTTTCVEISIQKVKIKVFLDTGSHVNVVFSTLVRKLKLAPSLNCHQSYRKAGLSMTCAMGTYSALPMRFGKLLLAAPAVVLENESCNLLVGTQFLRDYNGTINLKNKYLFILGYEVPLIFEEPIKGPKKRLKMCALEHPTGVFTLKYHTHLSNMKCPPMACPASEGIPLVATSAVTIPPGSQAILDSQISYKLPECCNIEYSTQIAIEIIGINTLIQFDNIFLKLISSIAIGFNWWR
ncbi:DNA damage-inducible protein 1 [Entomophthora muscae]|uniref:DNA damage-inducible protein 1 n=1 Tax=Entomophthora muscae TaxID=34485 RepID=A0ACC2UGU0_9FUNG|nr:DNA damage-inducible protein 1 [Entomophthora muscae]